MQHRSGDHQMHTWNHDFQKIYKTTGMQNRELQSYAYTY